MKSLLLFIISVLSLTLTKPDPDPLDAINLNINIPYEKPDGIQESKRKEISDYRDMVFDYGNNGNNNGYIKRRFKDIGYEKAKYTKYGRYDRHGKKGMFQASRGTLNKEYKEVPSSKNYCLTRGCIKAASDIIRNLDETVDPCKDFYKFACGSFIKETVIPEDKGSIGHYKHLEETVNERLLKLFEETSNHSEPTIFMSVRNFYKSCKNEEHIEKYSKSEFEDILVALGGWPVVEGDKWIENKFKWYILEQKLRKFGFPFGWMLLPMRISIDSKDTLKKIIAFYQPALGLPREFLIKGVDDKRVQAYLQYMVDTAVWLGASYEVAARDMKDVLDFEIILAKNILPRENMRNASLLYNPMKIQQLSKIYPAFPWVNHINAILDNTEVTVDEEEIVNISVPKYVQEFHKLIPTIPARVQANYMIWINAHFAMSYLNSKATNIKHKAEKVITGQVVKSPRWLKCVMSTSDKSLYQAVGSLSNAIGSMYVSKYFSGSAKDMADDMVTNIIKEFKALLDELDWMDIQTKTRAHKKADLITPHIAYPKEILNNKLLNDYYQGLVLNEEGYLKNILTLQKFIYSYSAREFRVPVDKHSWKTHGGAAKVNTFYNPRTNGILFPAGIFDEFFFGADRPLYMNYGAIGTFIGHEITHGFDDKGSQRDGHGNIFDWWKPKAKEKYKEKAQCVIDHYSNYTVDIDGETINLNGINSQGENIADMGGVKEAYRAYNKIEEKKGYEPLLPSLNYSQHQLFWLSHAQCRCAVYRQDTLRFKVVTDNHLPFQFRVNGACANTPEFAQDWNCSIGSKMNPIKRCTVW